MGTIHVCDYFSAIKYAKLLQISDNFAPCLIIFAEERLGVGLGGNGGNAAISTSNLDAKFGTCSLYSVLFLLFEGG